MADMQAPRWSFFVANEGVEPDGTDFLFRLGAALEKESTPNGVTKRFRVFRFSVPFSLAVRIFFCDRRHIY